MKKLAALGAVLIAAALSGCGGGNSSVYDAQQTQTCLEDQGLDVNRQDADYIALAAVNGGYLVRVGETEVNISFYRNSGDARQNLGAYKAFGGTEGATLYSKGNAVFAWDDTPTSDEKSRVDACLTGTG